MDRHIVRVKGGIVIEMGAIPLYLVIEANMFGIEKSIKTMHKKVKSL